MNSIFSQKRINNINEKLVLLGAPKNAQRYLLAKLILLLIIFLYLIFLGVYGLVVSPIILLIVSVLYDNIIINNRLKRRKILLETEAITYFKLLAFVYSSNKNIKLSLIITSKNYNSLLSTIVNSSLEETKRGKSLYDAIKDLDSKIPSKNLQAIFQNINESISLGSDITDLLDKQIKYLEGIKYQRDTKKVSYIPLKMLLLVIFILVPVVILLLMI